MEYTVTGEITVIEEMQTFSSGFTKRVMVVKTNETYPQDIALEFFKDKCGLLDALEVGQTATVAFNLRGSEYNGRYYVNLNGWKILEAGEQQPSIPKPLDPMQTPNEPLEDLADQDLPF